MNIIRKSGSGTINEIKGKFARKERSEEDLTFDVGHMPRDILSKMLVVCGKVGKDNLAKYEKKAKELDCDFMEEKGRSWVLTQKTIRDNYDKDQHLGVLLIGSNKELPATQISYQNAYAFTDWFIQDLDGDSIPDFPIGRIFGSPETVLFHMDPQVIDSDIAVVFDSQPGRSNRHVEGLAALGFDVEVLGKYSDEEQKLLSVCEFILQFSDGVFTSRIHGTPDRWATHNSVILTSEQTSKIVFEGYPVVYSEACSTAQEGPLLRAFLDQGSIYIGSTLDTLNNVEPFDNWRACPYCDGWKFGFLDLLDTYELIGQVKVAVDSEITKNLDSNVLAELENIRQGKTNTLANDNAVSVCEWVLFGNPLRSTTVGPDANYSPGRIVVDT
ncbi:hypothetical protein EU528_03865 [Candidatus Thorarchaeota archaeon]|nr:MAG: hypothetical protein EU528_03865 [Candidatus Thorarchaeota archaeon]